MILKIVRFLWFMSVVLSFSLFLYTYAGLPEEVVLRNEQQQFAVLSRETLFYIFLPFLALINSLTFVIRTFYSNAEDYQIWIHALLTTVNFFLTMSLFYLAAVNSQENITYTYISIVITGSFFLMVATGILGPLYLIYRKLASKVQS